MNLQRIQMLNSWPLHNGTARKQSGEGACLLRQKLIIRHRAGESIEECGCSRASALTRHDALCQRPLKCLLECINILKYSFIFLICFHACIQLVYSLHIHVFC